MIILLVPLFLLMCAHSFGNAALFALQGTASATINVEVFLNSYSNPSSDDCDGGNCDGFFGTCDNIFAFCVGHVGSTVCLDSVIGGIVEDDSFTFTPARVAALGISNPLVFTDLDTSVRMYETPNLILEVFCALHHFFA